MNKRFKIFLGLLALITILFLLLGPKPVMRAYYGVRYTQEIRAEAERYDLSPYLVAAVIYTESRFRSSATSEVGARGLMQLMPATAYEMAHSQGITDFQEGDLQNPAINIRLGSAYLAHLNRRFGKIDEVLAAYNAGPTVVLEWKNRGGDISYPETRHYVDQVKRLRRIFEDLYPEWNPKFRSI